MCCNSLSNCHQLEINYKTLTSELSNTESYTQQQGVREALITLTEAALWPRVERR